MQDRIGDWVQTYTGKAFWPLDPRQEEIDIEDIAHSLSFQCRFNGHCEEYYSVAEHSVFVSHLVPKEDALWGLLHDASEAYICDIPTPIKPLLKNYRDVEKLVMGVICDKFGLPHEQPESVHLADQKMLVTEVGQIMRPSSQSWNLPDVLPLGGELSCWSPWEAKALFMQRFKELTR